MSYTLTPSTPMLLQGEANTTGATTGAGGVLYLAGNCERLTVVCQGNGTITTGTISIEEAYYSGPPLGGEAFPSGTWSVIQTITGSQLTTGAQQVVHAQGSFWAVRARISAAIVGGGSVNVWGWGN